MHSAVDMFIIGAGPAGLCAALRLQQLGYRVMLIERSSVWPRPQIGEALTPGVKNIIDFLDANDALEDVPHLTRLPTRLCWRSRTPETVSHADSAVVDRASFDAGLLQLAIKRGVQVHRPATLANVEGRAGAWQLRISTPDATHLVSARMILDAQGRQNNSAQQLPLAPRLSAMWAEIAEHDIPPAIAQLTQVEALEHGWLWGTRLPDRRYRVMLLSDPATSRQFSASRPETWLRTNCAGSRLFASVAELPLSGPLQMCAATPYVAQDSWQDGRLKLGDAAFALDPISSSGVEKAMRFSLQAAIAIHTFCQGENVAQQSLARDFYHQRLMEATARHHYWTASYYRQAWCGDSPFWQSRACAAPLVSSGSVHADAQAMRDALQREIARLADYREPELRQGPALQMHQMIRLHHQAEIAPMHCVTGDKVELLPAIWHPHLEHPLAFWENEALLPWMGMLLQSASLGAVLAVLNQTMHGEKAQRLLVWLWRRRVLDVVG